MMQALFWETYDIIFKKKNIELQKKRKKIKEKYSIKYLKHLPLWLARYSADQQLEVVQTCFTHEEGTSKHEK